MPRINRGLVDGFLYHVLNRGNRKQKTFLSRQDFDDFIRFITEAKKIHPIDILAFCLMPNHFHFVLRPLPAVNMSKWMHWLMTKHVRHYNKKYETSGHVWQGRYKSFTIQNDYHLITALRYVEGNPVRACLVKSAAEWLWSSHKERNNPQRKIISELDFVRLPKDWTTHVDTPISEKEIKRIRASIKRQSPFGETHWREKVCRQLGLEHTLRKQGRPRKVSSE